MTNTTNATQEAQEENKTKPDLERTRSEICSICLGKGVVGGREREKRRLGGEKDRIMCVMCVCVGGERAIFPPFHVFCMNGLGNDMERRRRRR